MEKTKHKIPIMDIYLSGYLALRGINPELSLEGTRVIFEFPSTAEVCKLSREFNNNPPVPVIDFIKTIRQLRARMISMKGGMQ